MNADSRSLLLVDDDNVFRERLAQSLTKRGFVVRTAHSHDSAVELAAVDSPEFALVDLRMPGNSGLDTVRALHRIDSTTRIVVLTGYGSIATAVDAIKSGAVHYLTKPAGVEEIVAAFASDDAVLGDALATKESADGVQTQSETSENADVPSLARVEWEHIERVVQSCGGNISHAAKALGMHRRSLQRKLAKYPVRR
jgi:two-component system, response regulator RegA